MRNQEMMEKTGDNDKGYKRILKSTFIMGSSSVINTVLGIVRTKIIALLLGPSGLGLTGIYMTITSLVTTISGLGIRESGVRQIAGALGTGEEERISRTILSMRRVALFCGMAGCFLLISLSSIVSRFSFGNADHTRDILLLAVAVFFGAVSGSQTALIQGMRRIGDLAKVSMLGGLFGTVFSIPIIYLFGQKGIASYLLIVAGTGILTSWWFSRRIVVPAVTMGWRESLSEAKPLVKLGLALMFGALMTPCTQYLLRAFIVRNEGLGGAGIFHASTTLSVVYVHIILNAMITDFYPRLSAVAHDHQACRSLINDQVEVGLLLAVPGILAIMTFAPQVITLFYSSRFMPAVDILRWQILGVVLQVVTWPMGFMLRAKGNGKLFIWTELFANGLYLGLAWIGITYAGLSGIGMAYFGMNLSYGILIYYIVRTNFSFTFSRANVQSFMVFALATGIVFLSPYYLSHSMDLVINGIIITAAGLHSIRTLSYKSDSKISGLLLKLKQVAAFR